jgi:hypothetical protein
VSNDPYRPHGGGPSNELARLAQQGQARLQADQQGQSSSANAAADLNMRTAIGPVRGAPVRRAVLVLFVLSLVALIAGGVIAGLLTDNVFEMMRLMPVGMTGLFASVGLLVLYLFLPPTASRAGVEAERAWVASLPFPLEHYFDVIAAEPSGECQLRVELWWTTQGVDPRTLQGIIALFDTQSSVIDAHGTHASFMTGPISGSTGIRINRSYVHRNHRLGKAVHRLVDVVLMPIHRNAPLACVRLSRTY